MQIANIKHVFRRTKKHPVAISNGLAIEPAVNRKPILALSDSYMDVCTGSLDANLIVVLNQYADSINKLAIEIRKEGDLLLTLGVSDEDVLKAGQLAQMALSYANLGRGVDLKGNESRNNFSERKINVATGMALTKSAQQLLANAKKHNKQVINEAIESHRRVLASVTNLNLLGNI